MIGNFYEKEYQKVEHEPLHFPEDEISLAVEPEDFSKNFMNQCNVDYHETNDEPDYLDSKYDKKTLPKNEQQDLEGNSQNECDLENIVSSKEQDISNVVSTSSSTTHKNDYINSINTNVNDYDHKQRQDDDSENQTSNDNSDDYDQQFNDKSRRKMKDGNYKKFNTYFYKWKNKHIMKLLKKNANYLKLAKNQLKLRPLPNLNFKSNVNYDFNREKLKKNQFEIYSMFWGEHKNKRDVENFNFNLKIIKEIHDCNVKELIELFNKSELELMKIYLGQHFNKDVPKIQQKQCNYQCEARGCIDCNDYIDNFKKIILGDENETGILNDFLYTKGNNRMKKRNKKKLFGTLKEMEISE